VVIVIVNTSLGNLHQPLASFSSLFRESWGAQVTPHALLTHTTTLPSFDVLWLDALRGFSDQDRGKGDLTLKEWMRFLQNEISSVSQTQQPTYNGLNYHVLTGLIEEITGQSFGDLLHQKVFDPLNMDSSYFFPRGTLDDNRDLHPTLTHPFQLTDAGPYQVMPATKNFFFTQGGGGIVSTTRDLHKWMRALFSEPFFPEAVTKKCQQDYGGGFGYGIRMVDKTIFHLGYSEGANGTFAYNVPTQIGLIILSNVQSIPTYQLGNELFKFLGINGSSFRLD